MTTIKSLAKLAIAGSVFVAQLAFSHGYVSSPEGRSFKCKLGSNTGCGAVQYEPQSVEGPSSFPTSGVADGQLAAAGNTSFSALNQQSSTRWSKNNMSSGWNNFTWTFTAAHVTRHFKYFITKNGWNQNSPLARSSFDLSPFCSFSGNMQQPANPTTHNCFVPNRSGYHVILAMWEIGDTSNSFYQAIDVNFSGSGSSSSSSGGSTSSSSSSGGSTSSSSSGGNTCAGLTVWNSSSVYTGGDAVQHNGIKYTAKWWTRGQNPAQNSTQWAVWASNGPC